MTDTTTTLAELSVSVPSWAAYAAVAVSGVAGATEAARRGFDVVGVFGLAFATGVGGLLLRDLLLGTVAQNLFGEPWLLLTAFAAAVVGFFFAGFIARFDAAMIVLQGLAMGFLCVIGAEAALEARLPATSAVFIGAVTAVGGLVLRDVLAGTAPEIVRPGVFVAIPAILASILFVVMAELGIDAGLALVAAMALSLGLRAGAYWFGWHTGSAQDFSEKVWSFWIRRKPAAPVNDAPTSYTDILSIQQFDDGPSRGI